MAGVKWIKITTDMFDNRKIKHLRKLPDGNNIVLIWVMLLTMAGRCNSGGMIFLTENIPYTPKMLADELDFEENTVKLALSALEQFGMIVYNEEMFSITGWSEHQNVDGMEKIKEQTRKRVATHRQKQKMLISSVDAQQCNVTGNVTVTQCNATDIDIDKEEKNKNNNICASKAQINSFFDSIWNLYPVKKGKGQVSDAKRKALYRIGFDKIKTAIERYQQDLAKDAEWRKPQNGSTFFNSGYVDYLDENYSPTVAVPKAGNLAEINGKLYEVRNGKYYIPNGNGIEVNPFAEDDLPF